LVVYQYDKNGYFVGVTDDFGGSMPHNCTNKKPPQAKEGHKIRWDGDMWEYEAPTLPSLDELKNIKLQEVSVLAAHAYISGFYSMATSEKVRFDSTEADQQNILSMWGSTLSPNFATDPTYKGVIPMRGTPEGATEKQTYYLNKEAMQLLVDDLNRHIGMIKTKHWTLQDKIKKAKTTAALEKIAWE